MSAAERHPIPSYRHRDFILLPVDHHGPARPDIHEGHMTGEPIASTRELSSLRKAIRARSLPCGRVVVGTDGDVRFWDVCPHTSPVLERLIAYGRQKFGEATGEMPSRAFLMVNHTKADHAPAGSGGGWHRDSLRTQYKAFCYLTHVETEADGPLCYLPKTAGVRGRALGVFHWLKHGNHRYCERHVARKYLRWTHVQPILLPAGQPFFLNTSQVHRGLAMPKGERMAAAVYLYRKGEHGVEWD